MNNNIQRKIN